MQKAVYKRVIIKLSGEALAGEQGNGINEKVLEEITDQIIAVKNLGVEIGIIVGGGNFWRGRSSGKMDRTRADHMGMLATSINALALADALEQLGVTARVQTAIEMRQIAELYIRNKAVRHLEKGRVVVFGGGTGNPFMSTDTAAALRAKECVMDTANRVQEAAEDIYAEAQMINAERAAEELFEDLEEAEEAVFEGSSEN